MKNFHHLSLSLVFILVFCFGSCDSKLTGIKLIQKSIEYHDPKGQWQELNRVFYFADSRPGKPSRQYTVKIDLPANYFKYINSNENLVFEVDGENCIGSEQGSKDCERALMLRNYYGYLWGLPMKLKDKGTEIDNEYKVEDLNGIEFFVVRVPYEKDVWYFYFHPNTYALMAYKFYKDEEKKIGEIIYLKEQVIVGEMNIPSERSWFRTENNEFLGTDFLLKTEDPLRNMQD
ncbi:DUF6503 family protein [Aquiflexum sp. LQ15W]|uniref:DUF6503 family protein n=1 Tax=Cognataquiflexum nitidum TaxID=2922272 RepID=UPI001F13F534|nr:DUF6503 family protein [Cognataquiflexum nitidum]MCH6198945.1 DUF6503 family protein [Cognataquiflexum nitidum]